MAIKILEDRIASGAFFFLGILVMIEAKNLSLGDIHRPGPGFIPFFLGLSMTLLSAISFFSPDRKLPGDAFWNSWQAGRGIIYIFIGLLIYLFLFKVLGFFLDTLALIFFLVRVAGAKRYRTGILISIITMLVIYVVFYKILIIPFPKGILGV